MPFLPPPRKLLRCCMLEKSHYIAGHHVVPKIARVPGAHESFLAHSLSRYPVHEEKQISGPVKWLFRWRNCCQAWRSKFNPQDRQGGRRKMTLASCPLTLYPQFGSCSAFYPETPSSLKHQNTFFHFGLTRLYKFFQFSYDFHIKNPSVCSFKVCRE